MHCLAGDTPGRKVMMTIPSSGDASSIPLRCQREAETVVDQLAIMTGPLRLNGSAQSNSSSNG
jgi:hypothetical protein